MLRSFDVNAFDDTDPTALRREMLRLYDALHGERARNEVLRQRVTELEDQYTEVALKYEDMAIQAANLRAVVERPWKDRIAVRLQMLVPFRR